jgi:acyl carrier protein
MQMTEREVFVFLGALFRDLFMRDGIALKTDTSASDVEGWDSFRQIEILLATQEHFGIKFTTQEMDSLHNVGDLVRQIIRKTGVEV